jgi:putative transposase
MIDRNDPTLSIARQCRLLDINRSSFYYTPKPIKDQDLALMRLIDEQYLKTPTWGSRTVRNYLRRLGHKINRKRVQRLMRLMNLEALTPSLKPAALIHSTKCILTFCPTCALISPIRCGLRI